MSLMYNILRTTPQRLLDRCSPWNKPEYFGWTLSCTSWLRLSLKFQGACGAWFCPSTGNWPTFRFSLTVQHLTGFGEIVVLQREPTHQLHAPLQILRWWSTDRIYNVMYLHHQWPDEAHTLQFDSTGEYFETVEYEPDRPLELRDILWKHWDFSSWPNWSSWISPHGVACRTMNFEEISVACLQMDLARSSRGAGWANGYWIIIYSMHTPRLARF